MCTLSRKLGHFVVSEQLCGEKEKQSYRVSNRSAGDISSWGLSRICSFINSYRAWSLTPGITLILFTQAIAQLKDIYWYTVKYTNFESARKFPGDFANFQDLQEGKIIPVFLGVLDTRLINRPITRLADTGATGSSVTDLRCWRTCFFHPLFLGRAAITIAPTAAATLGTRCTAASTTSTSRR